MFVTLKRPALLKIYFIPLLAMIADGIAGAIGILYALELNADILQINLITTLGGTIALLLEVPFGIFSDRMGRKPMLIYTRAIIIVSTAIRVFATDPNHLLISSLLGGLTGGDFFPILLSMIVDVADHKERQEAISTMFLFSSIGMFIAPSLCSFLLLEFSLPLRNIQIITLAAQLILTVYIVMQVKETKPPSPKTEKENLYDDIKDLLRKKDFQNLMMISFFFSFSRSILLTYIQVYAKLDLNLSNAEVASFSIYSNLAIMIIRFLSATLLQSVPVRPAIISFLLIGSATGLAMPFVNNYLLIAIIYFMSGISYGAVRILESITVANATTSKTRGVANSIYQVATSFGGLMKLTTTPLVDMMGFVPVFVLGGVICLFSIIPPLLRKTSQPSST